MKKLSCLALCLLIAIACTTTLYAAPAVDLGKINVVVKDADGTISPEAGTADQPYLVSGNKSYTISYNGLETVVTTDENGAEITQEITEIVGGADALNAS